jgi:Ca2+-binding RTX toxin-like protein
MAQYITTLVTDAVVVDTDTATDPLVVVTSSGSITVNGSPAIYHLGNSAVYATIDGTVYSNNIGIQFNAFESSVTLSASGIVHGYTTGVEFGKGANILRNAGEIQSAQTGDTSLFLNSGVLLGGTDNYVLNTGSISGFFGIRAENEGYRNQIINKGTISGTHTAITLNLVGTFTGSNLGSLALDPSRYGVFNDGDVIGGSVGIEGRGPVRVVNTGLIQAADKGVSLDSRTGDSSNLTNSGTIVGALAFVGGRGNDTVLNTGYMQGDLRFSAGTDFYDGRGGVVTGSVDLGAGDDTAHGGSGIDIFSGGNDADELFGHGGDDNLDGGNGSDTLDGGMGADVLIGGAEDDLYVVDNVDDVVEEEANREDHIGGTDTVRASISYALGANVENLVLTGDANLTGTGNDLANIITGNDGNNLLDGGSDADVLVGGKGNDIYIVDNMADAITESAEEGTDTVRASVTHSLSRNVENLVLVGASDIDGTGNDLANTITGNAGSNVLDGGAGADILRGGDGNDTYVVDHLGDTVLEARGEGDDVVMASVNFALEAELESLVLTGTANINGTGNALANSIIGNDGANILDGGAGADNLRGGLGNDTYVVDDADDLVTEASEQGTDTVRASISYALTDEVEHLVLTGTEDLSGTGNGLDNALTGNSGSNVLVGHQGNDTLDGGAGRDTARFAGNRQNYTIVEQPDGSFIVTDNVGDDGVDVVQNVEVLQFRDQSVSLTNKAPAKPVVQGSVIPVDENAAPHRVVAPVLSMDSEGDALEYSFVTNPGNKFAIDPTNGVITLIGAVNYEASATEDPDLEIETTGPLTGQKFYRVVVTATETVSGVSSEATELRVYVNDVNEAPTGLSFSGGGITATISENANDGDLVGVGTLQALDPEGLNQFIYAFDTSGAGGSSGSGNAGGRFKVAALSDITRAETYTVTIKVTDRNGGPGAVSTYQDFLITVNPVDTGNTAPTNVRLASGGTVAEKSGFNATVGTVTATDNGGAANLRYTIADNAEFDIDAVTGRIFVKDGAVLDYEGARTYTVQVTATDTNGTGLSSDPQDIIITLSDVNEAATGVDFTGGPTLRAGAGLGAAVAVAAAVDPDTGTATFRNNKYRFANGTLEDGLFRINADTGAITTTRAVTAEDVGEKTLTVVAHDGTLVGPAVTYTFDILPALPNAAPTAPVVQGSVSAIDENSAPHKVIATVKASDAEGDAFTYALAVNPGNKFAINAATGVIPWWGRWITSRIPISRSRTRAPCWSGSSTNSR